MKLENIIKNKALIVNQSYINGEWVEGKKTLDVTNPATGEVIGKVPDLGASETTAAIDAAHKAFETWSKKPAKERSDLLRKWFQLIIEHADDLASLMTAEQGKPLAESKSEINYAASFVEWFSEEARRVRGDIIPTVSNDRRILALRQPIGVVAAVTPWNFPSAMITRKVAPALAAGCTVVVKPAAQTPYSALALAKLADMAGFPKGVINIVTGEAKAIGGEMTSNPLVRKVSFTGSTEVGKLLYRQSADTVKKISLELGGNAPFIVFDDADIDSAVKGALASKYRNTGQACTSTNRILLQQGAHDAFTSKLVEQVKKLKVCAGFETGAQQGPLIDTRALEKVERLLADAVKQGAKILTGGKRHALGGTFFEPTVITGITESMQIAKEEIFGPVSAVMVFKNEAEAIQLANNTHYGLASYFYTRDIGRIWRVSEALEFGMVGVNESLISNPVAPFGGMKESGLGREGSHLGIYEFTEVKYVCMGGL
ncbi:MAG: NAD-dependent succinate-semialdehyde dehydrogenase [Proteobacteria bacterium]|nr:NAD-dependent succinate-semialdehyde dehydrogenase [Pseudomonadota bacterium]